MNRIRLLCRAFHVMYAITKGSITRLASVSTYYPLKCDGHKPNTFLNYPKMRCSQVIRVMSSSSDEEKKRKLTFLVNETRKVLHQIQMNVTMIRVLLKKAERCRPLQTIRIDCTLIVLQLFLPSLDNQLSKPNPFHKMDTIQNQQKAKMLQGFAKISIGREEMTKMLSVIIEYYN